MRDAWRALLAEREEDLIARQLLREHPGFYHSASALRADARAERLRRQDVAAAAQLIPATRGCWADRTANMHVSGAPE